MDSFIIIDDPYYEVSEEEKERVRLMLCKWYKDISVYKSVVAIDQLVRSSLCESGDEGFESP